MTRQTRAVLALVAFALFALAGAQVSIPMTKRAPYTAPFHMKGQSINLRGGYLNVGEYFATIQVGGQDVTVAIDTGSSTLAIPDASCDGTCPTSSSTYDSTHSGDFETIRCGNTECSPSFCSRDARYRDQCAFSVSYAAGSGLRGVAAKDRISIGGYSGVAMFGRVLHEVGYFAQPGQAPGILGVAYNALNCAPCPVYGTYCNPPCYDTVLDRLHADSGMPRKFGMCLTEEGGVWDLGFVDDAKALTPIQYVPVIPGASGAYDFFTVSLFGARSGSQDIPLTGGYQTRNVLVDSGTTLIIAPNHWIANLKHALVLANAPLVNELFNFDKYGAPPTVAMTNAQASQYPDITFQFDNLVTVTLKWNHYLMDMHNNGQTRTLGFASDDNNLFILGDIFMQVAYVAFDQETNRVGFAPLKPGTCGSSAGSGVSSGTGSHTGRSLLTGTNDASSQDWSSALVSSIAGAMATLFVVAVVVALRRKRTVLSSSVANESASRDLEAHQDINGATANNQAAITQESIRAPEA